MLRGGVSKIKSKKAQLGLGGIVLMIMIIFVSLALIQGIFNQQVVMTDKHVITDESINVASLKLGSFFNATPSVTVTNFPDEQWKIDECPLAGIVVSNASGTALTVTTDYTLSPTTGNLNILNTTATRNAFIGSNTTLVDYSFCEDGYNKDNGSRSIAGQIGLFAVLALFVIIAGMGIKEWANN